MSETPDEAVENDAADEKVVEEERAALEAFVKDLNAGDVKSGAWFPKLLTEGVHSYTKKANWQYFQERYQGVPADAIVEQRIKMAARYAAIAGGASASAYTGAIAATIGSLGGASPLALPAAAVTFMADVALTTQLQLRLAWDIAVLYRVPLDTSDPDDLWKLIRVAFTIRSGGVATEGILKVVPAVVRPVVRHFYSGKVLTVGRALPVVGKHLLQRNVIKVGIPLAGIPLAVVLNRYTTLIAGRHAQAVFRKEASVRELARTLSQRSVHPQTMLWVAWLVITADHKLSDDEGLLMRHLVHEVKERHGVVEEQLAQLIEVDEAEVWRRLDLESGDLSDLVDAAERVAAVNGPANAREQALLTKLRNRCASTPNGSLATDSALVR